MLSVTLLLTLANASSDENYLWDNYTEISMKTYKCLVGHDGWKRVCLIYDLYVNDDNYTTGDVNWQHFSRQKI